MYLSHFQTSGWIFTILLLQACLVSANINIMNWQDIVFLQLSLTNEDTGANTISTPIKSWVEIATEALITNATHFQVM
jgi:hypothetical protein